MDSGDEREQRSENKECDSDIGSDVEVDSESVESKVAQLMEEKVTSSWTC